MIEMVEQIIPGVLYWFAAATLIMPLVGLLYRFVNVFFRAKG
jgi:hypothetical protein